MKKIVGIGLVLLVLGVWAPAVFGESTKVSLDFKDTDIRTVLKAFSQQTGLNVIADERIMGKITVSITNLEPLEALELLLDTYGYNYYLKDNTVVVSSGRLTDNLEMRSYILRYARTDDIKSILEDLMDKAAGESVTTSGKLNAVVITARPAKMRMLARILRSVDTPPAQVMVEAKIIELKSGSGDTTTPSSMGINWKLVSQNNPHDFVQQLTQESFNYGATSMGLYGQAQLLEGNLNAYLSALEKAIGYDLLASPTVTALNHEEAEILIGSKYGYKTTTTTQTGTSETVNFLDVGTKLKFTPHINDQEFIIMDIYPAVSEGSVVNGLPQENTTETRNRVLVKDGQSIIIGGLTKTYHDQVEYGIPILMHLPIIGAFFRRTQVKSEKREIMIIITPKIVTAKALELMSEKTKKMEKKQNQEAGAHGLIHFH